MTTCSTCGYEVVPGDHFCTNCGTRRDSADASVIPEASAPNPPAEPQFQAAPTVQPAWFPSAPEAGPGRYASPPPPPGQFPPGQFAQVGGGAAAQAAPPPVAPAAAVNFAGGARAPAGFAAPQPVAVCPNCGQGWGGGSQSCAFCGQVSGLPNGIVLSSAGRRFGGYLLDGLLIVVTLVIGWIIWSLVVWAQGQTPGKQLLGMRVVRLDQRTYAGWGKMFLREFLGKLIVYFVASFVFGIGALIADCWLLWDKDRQELWDKIAGTVVVNDPEKRLIPAAEAI